MNKNVKIGPVSGKLLVVVLLLAIVVPVLAAPDEAYGVVTNVVDGDTFDVKDFGRVRLADVDCPEKWTAEGLEAKNFTEKRLLGKVVYLDVDNKTGKDWDGRYICVVYLEDGTNFNKLLVDEGYATIEDYPNNEFDPRTWWNSVPEQGTQPRAGAPQSSVLSIKVYPKEEHVVIENNGNTPVSLDGWTLMDELGYVNHTKSHTYHFPPDFTLKAGASVTVHTEKGNNTATDLYWGKRQAIWNNDHDTAYLCDPKGEVIAKHSY